MTHDFNDKRVSVLGLGISNRPLVKWLCERGAIVTARDKKERAALGDYAAELDSLGVRLVCGDDYLDGLDDEIIFRSPGIRADTKQISDATAHGSCLTSEMELFFELCPCPIIGVTGSDGKTTTTTLISKLLEAELGAGKVFLGGNIGAPLLPRLDMITSDCVCAVELSSFQLQTMRMSPSVAVITNVAPNHLDYHRDMEEYTEAKKNIFKWQKPGDRLVLNAKNDVTRAMLGEAAPGVETAVFRAEYGFEDNTAFARVYEFDNKLFYTEKGGTVGEFVLDTADILLPGRHNAENYMAAIAAVHGIVGADKIKPLATGFGGVEHRCQFIRELDGVRYYNSSIDSSPTRTGAALSNFGRKVIAICGGYDKHIPFEPLAESLCTHAKAVVLTGATAGAIEAALLGCGEYKEGMPTYKVCADFTDAVNTAREFAEPGDIVILSPACASFDAFPNFEVRGHRFCEIVRGW